MIALVEEDNQTIFAWLAQRFLCVLEPQIEVATVSIIHGKDCSGELGMVPALDLGDDAPQVKV